MLWNEKNFSATSEDHNNICIWVFQSRHSNVFFNTEDLIEAFVTRNFIHKNDLSSTLDHAMTRIACEDKDGLSWFTLEETMQLSDRGIAFFNFGFHKNLHLIFFKSVTANQLFKCVPIIGYSK